MNNPLTRKRNMKWELFISWRYLVAKREERFISLISIISILGIAVGVMALIVVMAVMNGFDRELRQRIVSINPHIVIERHEGIEDLDNVYKEIESLKHVRGAAAFIHSQALLKRGDEVTGILFRGIDPQREPSVTQIQDYIIAGSQDIKEGEVLIGSELAKRLYLNIDDKVSIITSHKKRGDEFRVTGIFNSGMYEYDLNLVVTNLKSAQDVLGQAAGGIGVRVENLYQAQEVRKELQEKLGYQFWIRDWMSLNENLFSALKLEKVTMFIIVALIVVVACFNIAGTLIMMVMEKTKDIGIMKAIGASNRSIRRIFTIEGLIIGLLGTGLGASGGILLCRLLDSYQFIHLPRDIYYIDNLPVEMRFMDSFIIVACALAIALLATVYPARQAAKLQPAQTLRYE